MSEYDSESTTRLLAATLATHVAFTEAAGAVTAPGYAAEFARRAEYLGRVALHLRGQQAPAGLASDALWHRPAVRSVVPASSEGDGNQRELFDRCLRLLDVTTLEFCRGYGPNVAHALSGAMQAAHAINTTRHGAGASGWPDDAQGSVPGNGLDN